MRHDLSSHIQESKRNRERIYNLCMDLLKESTLHDIEEEINFVIIFRLHHVFPFSIYEYV